MLFSNNGFGVVPMVPGGGSGPVFNTGSNAGSSTTETSGVANNVCTSDGHLIYINGAWRLRSDPNQPCTGTIPSEDTSYVYNSGQRIYAGPFPIDLKNTGGQISVIDSPAQIGSDWGAWFAQALVAKARSFESVGGALPTVVKQRVQIFSLLPRVVGATQDYYDNGTPQGAPIMQTAIIDPLAGVWSLTPPSVPTSFPPVPPEVASGGHALHPTHAWFDNDDHGFRITRVMYANDPNTYSYYNVAQWIQALSPDLLINGFGWLLLGPIPTADQLGNSWAADPFLIPLAKFKFACNTCTETNDWGTWVGLSTSHGERYVDEGTWSTAIDGPQHATPQIALMPLPQPSGWEDLFNAIMGAITWLPAIIASAVGSIVFDIGQWLAEVACDMSKMQASLATIKDPVTKAEAIAAFAAASAACPSPPPPPDCAIFPNTPGCIKTVPAVPPWWKRWYIIIPALALFGFCIFKITQSKNKPRAQPAS